MNKILLLAAAVLISIVSFGQYVNNQSSFADKPADSYSNYRDENGKPGVLLWGAAKPKDFGSRSVTFNYDGVRKVSQVPAPGIHPRIYFGPDDLPEIRKNLKETQCGQGCWKNILSWTEMMKGNYDDTKEYAKPDVWKGDFGGLHGRVPLFRLSIPRVKGYAYNHNPLAKEIYDGLASGTAKSFPEFYWDVFSLEAFRCLIENDEAGAMKLANAAITALKIDAAKRDSTRAAKNITKPNEQPIGRVQLAFTYDFIFNWLTPEQKKAIHDELAENTWSHDNYGTFNTAEASRSNWATFSYWLFEVLAIEGEPGFNDLKVKGMYRGWHNLMTYGWFQSGATFEGEAKNQLGMDGIVTFAKRTKMYGFEDISGHPYLQAYARSFLPHSIIPQEDGFIKYDLLGGCHGKSGGANISDLLGLKYMFPNDKKIDWVYHKGMHDDYSNVPDRPDGYYNALLFFSIFATDFDKDNNDPSKLNLGNTFFCGERALMMTRSSWTKDALMLNLHTRQANGGHPSADRNCIMVAGAGRVWSPVQGGYAFDNFKQSIVVIDKHPQDEHTPATMVDFKDEPFATFAVGDAKYAWDYNNKEQERKKGYYTVADIRAGKVEMPKTGNWELEPNTVNHFSYLKLPYSYLNVPRSETPHWILPTGVVRPFLRQVNYPVLKAFRTAGVVRATKPFAIVVDDIAKDEKVHHYDWILTLEHDIQIVSTTPINDHEMDIILTGNDPEQKNGWDKDSLPVKYNGVVPAKQPMLLVKVLNVNNTLAANTVNIEEWRSKDPKPKESNVRRLIIPADAVSPDYKVLLYPYRNGDELPKINWNRSHTKLTVKWSNGEKQELTFSPTADGRTHITVKDGEKGFVL